VFVIAAAAAPAAEAAGLDGSAPMLCAVMAVTECDRFGGCEPADPASAGLPPFIRVNVGQKLLEATDGSGRKSAIGSSTLLKDQERLVLQGVDGGRAWSAVIGQRGGELTATIADHDGGFVVSGACTLP
jgi:hypothetical protein